MAGAARKAANEPRRREPPRESSVYDGSRLLGTITPAGGAFVAHSATGEKLGEFADERLAMRRVCAAARTGGENALA